MKGFKKLSQVLYQREHKAHFSPVCKGVTDIYGIKIGM